MNKICNELMKKLLNKYVEKIEKINPILNKCEPIKDINFNNFDEKEFKKLIDKKIKNNNAKYLYIIKNLDNFISKESIEKFIQIKADKKFMLSRVNSNNNDIKNIDGKNTCLYVGSSHDIKLRLREHIGKYSPRTYSLHLSKWFSGRVSIDLYIVENDDDNDLQLFEDLLWNEFKPIFGRQGKK